MKRALLLATMALALCAAACSGGASITPPPPPMGNFSDSSLKGQYAFSMSGEDSSGGFIARVGSFTADGSGNITSAIEDVVDPASGAPPSIVTFNPGTYSILANGRGTITLTTATGGLGLSIALNSSSQGLMVQTGGNATSSGSFMLQSPSAFSLTSFNGNYVFDVSGVDIPSRGAPLSIVGEINLNGAGGSGGGTLDENNGQLGLFPAQSVPSSSNAYQLDASNSAFGRGALTFSGRTFVFYIVDGTRIRTLEEDQQGATIGDAVLQTGTIPTQDSGFTGSYAFLIGGSFSASNVMGPLTRGGRFTADGSGGLSAVFADQDFNGGPVSLSPTTVTSASYSIDTIVAGTGRGTIALTDSKQGQWNFTFYLISPSQAVIQDQSIGTVGDGTMLAQTGGPFTNSSVAGPYAFSWSGVNLSAGFEEDFVGQYALASSSSNNVSGGMDFTELVSSKQGVFLNVALNGTQTINGNGTQQNTFIVTSGTSPSSTYNFKLYIVNANTVFFVGADTVRVDAGIASQQH